MFTILGRWRDFFAIFRGESLALQFLERKRDLKISWWKNDCFYILFLEGTGLNLQFLEEKKFSFANLGGKKYLVLQFLEG